jgi:2-polyprenyl-6-hydroxyphenyl methylase / 3-demethylubiquinone-9 3-methyltransferase
VEDKGQIDNTFYDTYGEKWYTAFDDPVALLRAENMIKIPWILDRIRELGTIGHTVLDVGCGGGFLTNDFARRGFSVTGVDISPESLRIAATHDMTHSVSYVEADAYKLPFPNESFDIVTNLDFLEHVQDPQAVINECARVLKKNGLFFFHTFNRNPIAELLVIRLVEKFIKNTPKNMHVIELFIKPEEMEQYCRQSGLEIKSWTGVRPVFSSISWDTLFSGVVSKKMKFVLTKSLMISYMGVARKI